jgi:formamidopyrimidine-DNA glycosylase
MPELPEVEIIRRIIEPQITGQMIKQVDVKNEQIIAHPKAEEFTALLTGSVISHMSRRGKFLTIHLENGDKVVLHLRMTGQLLVMPATEEIEKHTHLILSLSGGSQMRYIDVRRFGRFWYVKKDEIDVFTGQDKLGLEPMEPELTPMFLKIKLGKRKKAIKEMLHDQSIIAGIGNIYSDEILYAANIYPEKKCIDLEDDDWKGLAEKIPEIITWGIDTNEMTPEEYLAGKGKEYSNIPNLKAYGRAGKPCLKCGAVMEKITIGGRTSTYCPVCQSL